MSSCRSRKCRLRSSGSRPASAARSSSPSRTKADPPNRIAHCDEGFRRLSSLESDVRIRAPVLEEFGAPLQVQEVDLAAPRAGEVLVRLAACGVCHTDLFTASGADPSGYAPTVLGHEGAGVVESVGEGVSSVGPGDHVVTLFSPQCRECIHCRSTRT